MPGLVLVPDESEDEDDVSDGFEIIDGPPLAVAADAVASGTLPSAAATPTPMEVPGGSTSDLFTSGH